MGALISYCTRDPRRPIKLYERPYNFLKYNYRGILTFAIILVIIVFGFISQDKHTTLKLIWLFMFIFFLLPLLPIPIIALSPIALFPLTGIMSTQDTCRCYFNDGIALFILTSMLGSLLTSTNLDRRAIIKILNSGDLCQFSNRRMVMKASLAAFLLSIMGSPLTISSILAQLLTPVYTQMQTYTSRYRNSEPNYDNVRYIMLNAVHTSVTLGSTTIIHASLTVLTFRTTLHAYAGQNKYFPHTFNYFQYFMWVFPVAAAMYIVNLIYHIFLIICYIKKPMSLSSMTEAKRLIGKYNNELPLELNLHQRLIIIFTTLSYLMYFIRFPGIFEGMASHMVVAGESVPYMWDSTIAAIFVVLLHILPRRGRIFKFFGVDKKSELPPIKACSAILWWRLVDKTTKYELMFLIGAAVAFVKAIELSEFGPLLSDFLALIRDLPSIVGMIIITAIAAGLANVMNGLSASVILLPVVLNLATGHQISPYTEQPYLTALATGIACSFGFMTPIKGAPSYYSRHIGKVPILKMMCLGFLSVIICMLILCMSVLFFAPTIFGDLIVVNRTANY